ncbi:MAG: RNA polymerase sigma factor [Candidatus Cloacimonetes bacterium]|nr:RNA polymerase sigma factor [Candidatus Cloacimonadota bacterium]
MKTLEEIIEQYDDLIRSFALSKAKDRDLADDIVQETYLRVINNHLLLSRLSHSQIRSWLFTVIKNILIDKKRQKEMIELTENYNPSYDSDFELNANVEKLVSMLPEDEKAIVHFKYWQGMNSKEIAEMMDLPPSTVRWKLNKALNRLRTCLDRC